MKADDAIISSLIHSDLLITPHVRATLIELFTSEGQQEELIAHLTVCHHCRTSVISLLSIVEEQEGSHSKSGRAAHALLLRFARIHSALESHECEQIGAYAEAIVAQGYNAADQSFPDIAAHIKTCSDCRSTLENTIEFLCESEETCL